MKRTASFVLAPNALFKNGWRKDSLKVGEINENDLTTTFSSPSSS